MPVKDEAYENATLHPVQVSWSSREEARLRPLGWCTTSLVMGVS
jgi:hypothetical protein